VPTPQIYAIISPNSSYLTCGADMPKSHDENKTRAPLCYAILVVINWFKKMN
jgi:hypothetical protein